MKQFGKVNSNIISNYTTVLRNRIDLPSNEDWRVGLRSIQYVKSWFNVRTWGKIDFFGEDGKSLDENSKDFLKTLYIDNKEKLQVVKPGYYRNEEELINEIKKKLSVFDYLFYTKPNLYFDKQRNGITLTAGYSKDQKSVVFPAFGEEIEKILGLIGDDGLSLSNKIIENRKNKKIIHLDAEKALTTGKFKGPRSTELNAGLRTLYVYSNIVEHSFVGDAYAQILGTVPVMLSDVYGDNVYFNFNSPEFIPLLTKSFDTIEIDIKDDTGTNIPFESGGVIVKLEIKNYD